MREVFPQIRELGGGVLVVTQAEPAKLSPWVARQGHPFPVVGDPCKTGHRLYGLGRGRLLSMMGPGKLVGYLRSLWGLLARRRPMELPSPGSDIFQLGGDFVVDRRGRIAYAFRSEDPTDRPPVAEWLGAMRRAAETGAGAQETPPP